VTSTYKVRVRFGAVIPARSLAGIDRTESVLGQPFTSVRLTAPSKPVQLQVRLASFHAVDHERPYMDAPTLPSFQFVVVRRRRLHPYIRTFAAACAAVPDGMSWLVPNRFVALEVLRPFWV
jgi:hypothetical protein